MRKRLERHLSLALILGLLGSTAACGSAVGVAGELPELASLDETYEAVDAVLGCADDVKDPPHKLPPSGGPTGESAMCTDTVEVLWFDSRESYDNIYELFAATPNGSTAIYFVEGRNWFVADVAEVAVGAPVPPSLADLEDLAEKLGAKYTVRR